MEEPFLPTGRFRSNSSPQSPQRTGRSFNDFDKPNQNNHIVNINPMNPTIQHVDSRKRSHTTMNVADVRVVIANTCFNIADKNNDGVISNEEACRLVPSAQRIEEFTKHLKSITLQYGRISREGFIRYSCENKDFMEILKLRLDVELSVGRQKRHANWLSKRNLTKTFVVGRGETLFWKLIKTFLLILIPAAVFMISAVLLSKELGPNQICTNELPAIDTNDTCSCNSIELLYHVVYRRLIFSAPIHLYGVHLLSSVIRLGEGWCNLHFIIPLLISIILDGCLLYGLHSAFDGISSFVEILLTLSSATVTLISCGIVSNCVYRAVLCASPFMNALFFLIIIHAFKELVFNSYSADIVLSMWPVVVFVVSQIFNKILLIFISRIEAKKYFKFDKGGSQIGSALLPERQLLHVTLGIVVFNDAVRALLVITINGTWSLVINLLTTIFIECLTRSNIHKWLLSFIMRPCYNWTPTESPLDVLASAGQMYAGYLPFIGFGMLYLSSFFPWSTGFVDCVDSSLVSYVIPKTYVIILLFVTEIICTVLSLVLHKYGRCLLPSHLKKTSDLTPLVSLTGVVQCAILSMAMCVFVLIGFSGSGEIAHAAQVQLSDL